MVSRAMLRASHLLTLVPVLLLLLAAPAVAGGLNLLPNGDFDDLDDMDVVVDWYELFPEVSEMNNGFDDVDDCLDSGMGIGINTNPADFGGAVWSTCTNDVVVGETYRLTGALKFPVQDGEARASVSFMFASSLDCLGSSLGQSFVPGQIQSTATDWVRFATPAATAPEGTGSVRVDILVTRFDGLDPVEDVHSDRLQLMPSSYLFSEDFEDGSTCRWSGELGVQ
jgi:hypothetical protein